MISYVNMINRSINMEQYHARTDKEINTIERDSRKREKTALSIKNNI